MDSTLYSCPVYWLLSPMENLREKIWKGLCRPDLLCHVYFTLHGSSSLTGGLSVPIIHIRMHWNFHTGRFPKPLLSVHLFSSIWDFDLSFFFLFSLVLVSICKVCYCLEGCWPYEYYKYL